MGLLLKLERYHLLLFFAIVLSMLCNVIMLGGAHKIDESALMINLMSYSNDASIAEKVQFDSDDYAQEAEQYSKLRIDSGTFKIILDEGDVFSQILWDIKLNKRASALISEAINKVYKLKKLRAGEELELSMWDADGKMVNSIDDLQKNTTLSKFILDTADVKVQVTHNASKNVYEASIMPVAIEEKFACVSGRITDSFFNSAKASGLSRPIVMDLVNILGHQVDFQRDIYFGGQFKVVHEYQVSEKGKKIKDGKVIYAFLQTKSKNLEVYLHEFADGTFGYFNKDGSSVKKVLLRTPVKNAVISSGFGMRKHPILGYSRMHRGLDYAAPKGTPVIASGDGVVEVVRAHVNYGRYIKIKHNGKYSTLYAHLDRFAKNIIAGAKVKQGEVIGYVGSTGMSTGPHLHYEVHRNGTQVNPAKVTMVPKSQRNLSGAQLVAFKQRQTEVAKSLNNDLALANFSSNSLH